MPIVQDTIASPKQWGYRTKITPHFDAPPKGMQGELRRRWEEMQGVGGGGEGVEGKGVEGEVGMVGGGEDEEGAVNGGVSEGQVDSAISRGAIGATRATGATEAIEAKKQVGKGTCSVTAGDRTWELRIGFERKGRPGVMDIEVSEGSFQVFWFGFRMGALVWLFRVG